MLIHSSVYSNAFLTLLNVRGYMAGIWDNSDWAADWNTIHPSQIPDVESFQLSTRGAGHRQAAPVNVFLEGRSEGVSVCFLYGSFLQVCVNISLMQMIDSDFPKLKNSQEN